MQKVFSQCPACFMRNIPRSCFLDVVYDIKKVLVVIKTFYTQFLTMSLCLCYHTNISVSKSEGKEIYMKERGKK